MEVLGRILKIHLDRKNGYPTRGTAVSPVYFRMTFWVAVLPSVYSILI